MEIPEAFDYRPDPDNPGWYIWQLKDPGRFNDVALGPMIVRRESDRTARTRLLSLGKQHSNLEGSIHGGAILGFVDIALFSTVASVIDLDVAGSLTVDLSCQFISAGSLDRPLDCVGEITRETGRMIFLRGLIEQGDHGVATFIATLRKPTRR